MRIRLLALATFAGILAAPAAAQAQNAFATGNVNMRTCGSTSCRVIATIPAGAPVAIFGCTSGYRWCDTQYANIRGWVSGRYLSAAAPGYASPSPLPAVGALLGIAIVGAAIADSYDRRYYHPPYGWGWRPPHRRGWYGQTPSYPGWGGTPRWNAPGWNAPGGIWGRPGSIGGSPGGGR